MLPCPITPLFCSVFLVSVVLSSCFSSACVAVTSPRLLSCSPNACQCFFSYRIVKTSNNHLLAFLSFVFCIFSFTAALGAACVFFTDETANLAPQLSSIWIFPVVLILGLICDLVINVATAFCLRSQTRTEVAECVVFVSLLIDVHLLIWWYVQYFGTCRPSAPLGRWSVLLVVVLSF